MNATKRDYYEILSVSRECDDAGLKSAYRKLALKYHPDRNPNDQDAEERFKEAAEAYSVLSDPQKRAAYDRYGHQGLQGMGAQGFDPSTFTDFGDIELVDLEGDHGARLVERHVDVFEPVFGLVEAIPETVDAPESVTKIAVEVLQRFH